MTGPPSIEDIFAVGPNHEAPRHDIWIAEAQKAEPCFEEDGDADCECRGDDERRHGVGQDDFPDDALVFGANGAGGCDVFQLFDFEKFCTGEPSCLRPAYHANGHSDGEERGRKERWTSTMAKRRAGST